jgi:hypothetical protein
MDSPKKFAAARPALSGALLWTVAAIATLACLMYQDRTGPTYPLEGEFDSTAGTVRYKFLRSETIGTDLAVVLLEPVPAGITGYVEYRRFRSHDDWSRVSMTAGEYKFSRRGRTETLRGAGAALPTLRERAGRYEYFVYLDDGRGEPVSVTGEKPIYARYKAAVPHWVLVIHVAVIFVSMALAVRTTLEALVDGSYGWMLWATIGTLLLGGFFLGPLVQWYAFGVWWSGIPHGYDWTDNKVLVELAFWLLAAVLNRGGRRSRRSIYVAFIVTLVIYFIPHSLFGSVYDYRTGTGHGTGG